MRSGKPASTGFLHGHDPATVIDLDLDRPQRPIGGRRGPKPAERLSGWEVVDLPHPAGGMIYLAGKYQANGCFFHFAIGRHDGSLCLMLGFHDPKWQLVDNAQDLFRIELWRNAERLYFRDEIGRVVAAGGPAMKQIMTSMSLTDRPTMEEIDSMIADGVDSLRLVSPRRGRTVFVADLSDVHSAWRVMMQIVGQGLNYGCGLGTA